MDQSDQSKFNKIDDSVNNKLRGQKKSHERDGRQHIVSSNGSKGRADCWK